MYETCQWLLDLSTVVRQERIRYFPTTFNYNGILHRLLLRPAHEGFLKATQVTMTFFVLILRKRCRPPSQNVLPLAVEAALQSHNLGLTSVWRLARMLAAPNAQVGGTLVMIMMMYEL